MSEVSDLHQNWMKSKARPRSYRDAPDFCAASRDSPKNAGGGMESRPHIGNARRYTICG
jgi:hypothetical protein